MASSATQSSILGGALFLHKRQRLLPPSLPSQPEPPPPPTQATHHPSASSSKELRRKPSPCGGAIPNCMLEEFNIPSQLIDRHVTRMRIFPPPFSPSNEFIAMLRREVLDSFLRDRAVSSGASLISGLVTSPLLTRLTSYTTLPTTRDVVIGADGTNI